MLYFRYLKVELQYRTGFKRTRLLTNQEWLKISPAKLYPLFFINLNLKTRKRIIGSDRVRIDVKCCIFDIQVSNYSVVQLF